MNIATIFRPMSVTQFQEMVEQGLFAEDARLELIDGRIQEMSPVGRKHAATVKRVADRFPQQFGKGYTYGIQDPIQLSDDTQPQPDYTILRYREDYYEAALPTGNDILLVVEVSDSTLIDDLTIKLPRYAQAEIPEVWIVEVNTRSITRFQTPQNGVYLHQERYTRDEEIVTTLGVTIAVKDIVG